VAQLHATEASEQVGRLLADSDTNVRLAAVSAAGALQIESAANALLNLAQEPDLTLRRASLNSLRLLKERRVVPLAIAALNHRETQLAALDCLSDLGGPPQLKAVLDLALHDPSAEVLASIVRLLTRWSVSQPDRRRQLDRAVAEVQGTSGVLLRWKTVGPFGPDAANALATRIVSQPETNPNSDVPGPEGQTLFASGAESRVTLGSSRNSEGQSVWLAHTDLLATEPTTVQFLESSRGALSVWLNGQRVYQHEETRASGPGSDGFDGALRSGMNHLVVQVNSTNVAEFSVRFRRKSAAVEHERLAQEALSRSGNVERGRKLFFNAEKSQCLKCHRLADQGEQIGPDLTGVGGRFSRVYIIESILEPSRAIAPSFQMIELVLNDGRELSGVPIADRDGMLTLADNQGRKQTVARSAIKEQRTPSLSLMPEGLEKAFTTDEFIDLVEFLVSHKQTRSR
jgi:putative heme-binding domain-containing protein